MTSPMTVRPITFTGPMVQALLKGRKTQTRRVLTNVPPAPPADCHQKHQQKHPVPYLDSYCSERRTPENPRGMSDRWCWWQVDDRQCLPTFRVPFVPGDLLYVRECWRTLAKSDPVKPRDMRGWEILDYIADEQEDIANMFGRTRAAMHMPRWASRLTLKVTEVRVERVKDISEADAKAEGWGRWRRPVAWFSTLWDSINAKRGYSWEENPWVIAISFEVILRNVDEMLDAGEGA